MKDFHITPRQLRNLNLLLLLLPLVPAALLFRVLWGWTTEEAQNLASEVSRAQAFQLELVSERFLRENPHGSAAELVVYGEKLVGGELAVVAADGASIGGAIDGEDRIEVSLGPPLPGYKIVAAPVADLIETEAIRDRKAVVLTMGVVVTVVVCVAGVAGYAIQSELKVQELKSDFLATVSHELKTPVASARLLLDTLRDSWEGDAETVNDYVGLLTQENHRMARIVENFLVDSNIEHQRQFYRMDSVFPAEIVELAADEAFPVVAGRRGTLVVRKREAIPTVCGDRAALVTVIASLLDNAIKYSDGEPDLELDTYQSGASAFFQVADRGIGVPATAVERIFDRFYQVDRRLSRQRGGCGLGLSIARQIVAAHGGEIGVRARREGRGSIFWLRLPLEFGLDVADSEKGGRRERAA